MSEQVVVFSHDMGSKLVLSTNDRYSMDTAAEILSWLEQADDCSIHVVLGSIEFVVMCSYSEIFISSRCSSPILQQPDGQAYALASELLHETCGSCGRTGGPNLVDHVDRSSSGSWPTSSRVN
jgi:hypothetical protein